MSEAPIIHNFDQSLQVETDVANKSFPLFERIRLVRQPSNFQFYGEDIKNYLKWSKESGDLNMSSYIRDSVLCTASIFMEAKARFTTKVVVIVFPTGAEKLGVASLLPYVLQSEKVLILAHSKAATEQYGIAYGKSKRKLSFIEESGVNNILEDISQTYQLLEMPLIVNSFNEIKDKTSFAQNAVVMTKHIDDQHVLYQQIDQLEADVRHFLARFDTLIVDDKQSTNGYETVVNFFLQPDPHRQKKVIFLTLELTSTKANWIGSSAFITPENVNLSK